jgi:hypothetical protein
LNPTRGPPSQGSLDVGPLAGGPWLVSHTPRFQFPRPRPRILGIVLRRDGWPKVGSNGYGSVDAVADKIEVVLLKIV